MAKRGYVAFDLGAESGRAMLATLDAGKLELAELHRFANRPQRLPSGLHWDLVGLWGNLLEGLGKCAAAAKQRDIEVVSLGVDTWGVDCGLVGASGQLLGLPFAYRDSRNPPAMKRARRLLGDKTIYGATGIQFLPFNTLYQLLAQHAAEPQMLRQTRHVLLMPDLLHYFFSGVAANEATIASTTQMIDPRSAPARGRGAVKRGGRRGVSTDHVGTWATGLLKKLGLPTQFLGEILPAGTKLGALRSDLAKELGIAPLPVILPGSHDTASAVAAVPASDSQTSWGYLSSGTWSLIGAELDEPVITDRSRRAGFTNERGVGGKIRFLKNIAGLWLVQECRRDLARRGNDYSYQQLTELAAQAEPLRTLVDPNDEVFGSSGDMFAKIDAFARATSQPLPQTPGAYVRCCLESLALCYRQTIGMLEKLLGRPLQVLHVVGGGGKNTLLNQMTADAINRPVLVGPYEATAMGNALAQAMGAGDIGGLDDLRHIVRQSADVTIYQPHQPAAYADQDRRVAQLTTR